MQELASLKPLLTALVMPPSGPLLLVLLGLLCLWMKLRKLAGLWVSVGLVSMWVLSCNAAAVWLAENAAGQPPAVSAAQVKASGAQAIVVLGGGVEPVSPEYGQAQLGEAAAQRLRYGAWLASQTGLPVAYSGGVGWGGVGLNKEAEAVVAQRIAAQELPAPVTYVEARSRDTVENAQMTWQLLAPQNIQRVALVTNAWHMRRAQRAFQRAGFEVIAAPMGYVRPEQADVLEWLPSGHGLASSRHVLREWLGYQLGR
jgi:uncharacterized SAM-binding protein YcdF (DUF218 family)